MGANAWKRRRGQCRESAPSRVALASLDPNVYATSLFYIHRNNHEYANGTFFFQNPPVTKIPLRIRPVETLLKMLGGGLRCDCNRTPSEKRDFGMEGQLHSDVTRFQRTGRVESSAQPHPYLGRGEDDRMDHPSPSLSASKAKAPVPVPDRTIKTRRGHHGDCARRGEARRGGRLVPRLSKIPTPPPPPPSPFAVYLVRVYVCAALRM
ncbi:hypothetical protein B0T18DRAFT_138224 [Schizothecium vesticola]|uniref:Uncharacterized protein n=1 Tax=Schizothecium vesticola TaxID=314040 RepID=A0AA40EUP1_9PEZI|nr:hypothetical protein B0T18DRAFT_138224 [Schizothecium vesticola]